MRTYECEMCNKVFKTMKALNEHQEGLDLCVLCNKEFMIGEDGNELGFCCECQEKSDFPYDLDKYYEDYDNDKVVFKGFETMSMGILEKYRKVGK